jgi:hypothetical protein
MFERYTDRARRVVVLAQEEARMLNHNYIGTEHILLGLIHEGEGVAAKALELVGINLDLVRLQIEEIIGQGQQAPSGHIPFTPRAKKVLELSLREALQLGHNYVGTEHILLGLIRENDGVAGQVLVKLGADLNRVRQQVIQLLHGYQGKEPTQRPTAEQEGLTIQQQRALVEAERKRLSASMPTLDKFSSLLFAFGPDTTVGRDNELSLMLQVLSRRTRNSPVLVGESEAEKTALIEAFATTLLSAGSSDNVRYKFIYKLDRDKLLDDDTTSHGDTLKIILKELERRTDIILVLDDMPAYLAAQDEVTTVLGAASILRPLLARGKLQVIGTTTADRYRRLVEPDRLLSGSFQPIYVSDLTIASTLAYLRHLRAEKQDWNRYDIAIADDALTAAAILAAQYTSSASIPAAPEAVIDGNSNPTLQSSEMAFDEEPRMGAIRLIKDAIQQALPSDIRGIREEIADVRHAKESAIDSQKFEQAKELRERERQLIQRRDNYANTGQEIDEESILAIIATRNGTPVAELRKTLDDIGPSLTAIAETLDRYQPYVLLNDQPLEGVKDDLLGTDNIAAGIASLLTTSRSASPFVVGIDAGWGMGKSTLLRQIESELASAQGIATVRFNAWTAEGQDALEGLIKSVLVQLDKNVIRRYLRKLAGKRRLIILARISIAVVTRFLGITRLVDELWNQLAVDARTRNQLRDLIQGMLSDWVHGEKSSGLSRSLIVFIDDLDRCTDEVVVQVCEAVKLYLDAPGLVFVIACDLSVIARSVGASARGGENDGRTYLEKIVQVIYHLPPPDDAQLNELIGGYALRSGTASLIDRTVTKILMESAGRNPRRIKRIINSIVLENRLNPAWSLPPLNRAQLVTAILLQHLYPSFYDLLTDEASGEDPIGNFLDYVEIRAGALNPPPPNDAWWSNLKQIFEVYGMRPPDASHEGTYILMPEIERLERELPENFLILAHNSALIALLRGVGDSKARIALRSQLMRRPLTTEAI